MKFYLPSKHAINVSESLNFLQHTKHTIDFTLKQSMLQRDTLSYCRYKLRKMRVGYARFSFSFLMLVLFHPYWTEAISVQLDYLSVQRWEKKTSRGGKKITQTPQAKQTNTVWNREEKSLKLLFLQSKQTTLAFTGWRYKYLQPGHSDFRSL